MPEKDGWSGAPFQFGNLFANAFGHGADGDGERKLIDGGTFSKADLGAESNLGSNIGDAAVFGVGIPFDGDPSLHIIDVGEAVFGSVVISGGAGYVVEFGAEGGIAESGDMEQEPDDTGCVVAVILGVFTVL